MKHLLVVVFASACAGSIPSPEAPVVEYPRGPHMIDHPTSCGLARLGHNVVYNVVTCTLIYQR